MKAAIYIGTQVMHKPMLRLNSTAFSEKIVTRLCCEGRFDGGMFRVHQASFSCMTAKYCERCPVRQE